MFIKCYMVLIQNIQFILIFLSLFIYLSFLKCQSEQLHGAESLPIAAQLSVLAINIKTFYETKRTVWKQACNKAWSLWEFTPMHAEYTDTQLCNQRFTYGLQFPHYDKDDCTFHH